MIFVVATIDLAAGKREAFLTAQRELLPLVLAEAGCVEYAPSVEIPLVDPAKQPPRPDCVIMHEKWETLPHLQAHLTAPHMKSFREKVKDLVAGVKVEVFQST